jgi:uncharacterized protein YcbX
MITISSLIYYPIKACRGFEVESAYVERMGLANDRRLMVVTPEGEFLTQRELPRLALVTPALHGDTVLLSAPNYDAIQVGIQKTGAPISVNIWKSKGVQAIDQGEEAAEWFSDWLGTDVRLVHFAEGYLRRVNERWAVNKDDHTGFADGYPILLASEEGLADLNSRLESSVPMNRFRPNIVVKGCEPLQRTPGTESRPETSNWLWSSHAPAVWSQPLTRKRWNRARNRSKLSENTGNTSSALFSVKISSH